ncbi:hypothetical protein OKA04_08050 [Luteolibacter flavescens]|uniref:Uncharacterized protein n=1 Tax=Luteolibacter flavescens TaxID=1859460 RepID=A0ABT3FM89_9BACT|nr:hypothetical protein [Luteolibacter flavescens]MCW1884678.1 hypothetical protein [Luteolibacter flavescens]
MKFIGLAGILAISSLACQPKEDYTSPSASQTPEESAEAAATTAPAATDGEKKDAPDSEPTKAEERTEDPEKKIPVAEPLADQPGYVKSPFSGQIIDVRGIPTGTLVADPTFPLAEKKHFRVPAMPELKDSVLKLPIPKDLPVGE